VAGDSPRHNSGLRLVPSAALAEIGAEVDGVPFLRPEIVLLYKAGEPSPKNDTDFEAVHKVLSENARSWLRRALELCDPSHRWLVKTPK